jgi:co-chaperonin GroES (HSP10)
VTNESGLKPLGRAVLVKPYEPELLSSIIAIPESAQQGMHLVEQRAVVIEVGAACWPDEPARAKPGDKVLIARFAGHMAVGTKDGAQYRFVNDRDIFAAIEVE